MFSQPSSVTHLNIVQEWQLLVGNRNGSVSICLLSLLISLRLMVGLSVGYIWLKVCARKLSSDDLCWPHQLIYYEAGEISSLFHPLLVSYVLARHSPSTLPKTSCSPQDKTDVSEPGHYALAKLFFPHPDLILWDTAQILSAWNSVNLLLRCRLPRKVRGCVCGRLLIKIYSDFI